MILDPLMVDAGAEALYERWHRRKIQWGELPAATKAVWAARSEAVLAAAFKARSDWIRKQGQVG